MKTRRNTKLVAALIVLAIVCIAAAELVACRIFDPELFDRVTAPVVRAANWVDSTADRAAGAVSGYVQSLREKLFGSDEPENVHLELTPEEPVAPEDPAQAPVPEAPEETVEPEPEAVPLSEVPTQLAAEPVIVDTEPVTDPAITELRETAAGEILTGGNMEITYYNQTDEQWSALAYGTDYIGRYGCGPTAMAMVVTSMTDTAIDPEAMSKWAVANGHWCSKQGSYLSIVPDTAESYGLAVSSMTDPTPETIQDALLSGKLLVALMGPGHFTQNGHFIVLRGMTLSGGILVADPSSRDRSLTVWDGQVIIDELSSSTWNGGPLWVISRAAVSIDSEPAPVTESADPGTEAQAPAQTP